MPTRHSSFKENNCNRRSSSRCKFKRFPTRFQVGCQRALRLVYCISVVRVQPGTFRSMSCGMYVHCTVLHTCPLALLAHANFAPPCQRESQKNPSFEIKECNIVRTHSCDSKEAKMRSRNAFSDSNQQIPIFKYH